MPRVSILIPSYNHARFLSHCLASVKNQTVEDWELILVDDGSTDNSVAIARSFAQDDSRISVLQNEKNLGTYGTEQRALGLSRGEFVAVLNSDDFWAQSKLEKQVKLLDRHPDAPYAYTLGWLAYEENEIDETRNMHAHWPTEEVQEPLPHLLYENRIFASSVLFRRDALRFEKSCRYSGDWVALLEQSCLGPAACVSDRVSFWRQHGINTSAQSVPQILEEIRVRKAIRDGREKWFVPRLDPKEIWRGLATNQINLQALYALCGCGQLARKEAALALRWHPKKKIVLKRCLASLLPTAVLRKRLWKGKRFHVPTKAIAEIPALHFRQS